MVAAAAKLVGASAALDLGSPLDLMVPHAVQTLLLTENTQSFSASQPFMKFFYSLPLTLLFSIAAPRSPALPYCQHKKESVMVVLAQLENSLYPGQIYQRLPTRALT